MLNLIFQTAKANGKTVIKDNRAFFSQFYDPSWFDDPIVQNIIYYIDGSDVVMDDILQRFDGKKITGEQISTGAKTVILIWKFPRCYL